MPKVINKIKRNKTTLARTEVLDLYKAHVNLGFGKLAELIHLPIEQFSDGCLVYDENNNPYLDCGGFGVFILGHRHPEVIRAVKKQLDLHPMATRSLINSTMARTAKQLVEVTPVGLDYVFFTNSGAESVELGLKLARLHGKTNVIAMEGGFHGKTMGALSVTGKLAYQEPFLPLLSNIEFVPYGDTQGLEKRLNSNKGSACVILEPVQGEAGVIIPPVGFIREIHQLCQINNAFLIVDEIQTGMGRLGHWWGIEPFDICPDIMLVGKGLSGGVVPVGAVLATKSAFEPLNRDPLLHSSTFAGNPLALAAASAAIGTLKAEGLVQRAQLLGKEILSTLQAILHPKYEHLIREIRGQGLLIGIEFHEAHVAGEFLLKLLDQRVIVSNSLNTHKVLRFTPPAILSQEQLNWLYKAIAEAAMQVSEIW